MGWIKVVVAALLGGLFTTTVLKISDMYAEMDCGYMKGYTTHVVYEHGYLICVWRQDSWPFKTISGIKA